MASRTGRGPSGTPPTPPAGRARPLAAALTLVALAVLAAALAAHATAGSGMPAREPPFRPGPLRARDRSGELVDVPRPGILLYVDDECPFCALELARWSSATPGSSSDRLPTVILSPRSDRSAGHVPTRLRARALHDADGSVARSLGVRSVPFRAVLDGRGTVLAVEAGLSPQGRIDSLLDRPRAHPEERNP